MEESYRVKVTRIKNRWHARLFDNGVLVSEMACELQQDIGWICRELLRWRGKLGSVDPHVNSARDRQTDLPKGKVFYSGQLEEEKERKRNERNVR